MHWSPTRHRPPPKNRNFAGKFKVCWILRGNCRIKVNCCFLTNDQFCSEMEVLHQKKGNCNGPCLIRISIRQKVLPRPSIRWVFSWFIRIELTINCAIFCLFSQQIADIREFEDFADTMPDMESYPLYQNAIKHLEESNIPARMMRTEMVNCSSDLEYLAKLHCIRLAFQYLFKVSPTSQMFAMQMNMP